ncbi:MAG TPA: P-loop NTPase fold protein [Pyrinomonadaceae bacterium]
MTENNQAPDATVPVSEKNECTTNLLLDEPELIDAFNGPHERIAANIATLISRKDAKGISIGVEGSWGSGKSTVARLLIKKLQSDNTAVISFDAWAHEGDPLRRTFLETLIRRLKELKWIDPEKWNQHIEVLANRQETVTTKDELTFSRSGALVAFLFLLLPVGAQFIAEALKEIERYPPIRQRFWLLSAVGVVLTALPFIVTLVLYKTKSDVLGIFFNRGLTGKTTVTQKTGNPTSIEFEDRFTELIEEAFIDPTRRIVILLDNLDRVDSKDALLIWSTLQTFLQHRELERPPWRERLWLVVLYDLKGLSSLWQSEDADDSPANGAKKSKTQTAASFIDKSFQIRFEVPSLVLSDWGRFLKDQLKKAFPNHPESDLHEVYRVLAIGHAINQTAGSPVPTIRELKLFVNQMGAIHRQWTAGPNPTDDKFQLSHIAYYVYLRRAGADIVKKLLVEPPEMFPRKEYRELLGDGVRESLAAMAFNVEVDVAQQLLFSDKIKNALTLASSEELQRIEKQIPKGFWEIFEQIVTSEWTGEEVVKIADAASALEESKLLVNAPESSVRSVTRTMCRQAAAVPAWVPLNEKRAQGLATFVKWKIGGANESDANKLAFVRTLLEGTVTGLRGHVVGAVIQFSVTTWIQWVNLLFEETLPEMRADAFKAFTDKLFATIESNDVLPTEAVSAILEVASELAHDLNTDERVRDRLKELAGKGEVMSRLDRTAQVSASTVGLAFYLSFRYAESEVLPGVFEGFVEKTKISPQLIEGAETVTAFTDTLARFNQLPLLFRPHLKSQKLKSLLLLSLRSILATDKVAEFFAEDLVSRIEFVYRDVAVKLDDKITFSGVVEGLLKKHPVASQITAGKFHPESAWLYRLVLKTTEGKIDLTPWCRAGLQTLSLEIWQKELALPGQLLKLAFQVMDPERFELGYNFPEALKDYANQLVSGDPDSAITLAGNAAALLGRVDGYLRLNFCEHLLSLLDEDPGEDFFKEFGEELIIQLLSSDRGDELLTLFASLDFNLPTLQWLSQTLTQHSQAILERYSRHSALKEFTTSIENRISRTPPDRALYGPLSAIAKALHLELLPEGALAFTSRETGPPRIVLMDALGFRGELSAYYDADSGEARTQPSWSPDGLKVAYVARFGDLSEVRLIDLKEMKGIDLFEQTFLTSSPSFSPDGKRLAFVNNVSGTIWTINISSGEQKQVLDREGSDRPRWSPDGEEIVLEYTSDSFTSVLMLNADGSEERLITHGPNDVDPSWTPDGTRVLFARREFMTASGIYELNVKSRTDPVLILPTPDPHCPILLPDNDTLLFQSGSGSEATINRYSRSTGELKKIADGSDPAWVSTKGMPSDTTWLPLPDTK